MLTQRLKRFRAAAYERGQQHPASPKEENCTHAFFELYAGLPLCERQARTTAYALAGEPVCIHPDTRLAGQIYQNGPGSGSPEVRGCSADPRWREFSVSGVAADRGRAGIPDFSTYAPLFGYGGSPGHICWDFARMLALGTSGLIQRCREFADISSCTPEQLTFYRCVEIVLLGLETWVSRHVQALRAAAAACDSPARAAELREMAAICERVPKYPARNFREAIQSFHFQHLAVMFENPFGGNGPGRLDTCLWPYLEADLAAGRCTLADAEELITELFITFHERLYDRDGWVEAIPVGGRHRDGNSAVNPLSHMMIRVIRELNQTHPSVYVRLHDGAPEDFVDLSVDYLLNGRNRAQIYGDDRIIDHLHRDGVALEDARNWTAGGCMEVSPQGCSCDLLFAFAFNVLRTFELVINGGCLLQTGRKVIPHSKTLADYASFAELYEDFRQELQRGLGFIMKSLDIHLDAYARCRPSFLLSSMVDDCLSRGRAINEGGARYMDYGGSGNGIPNVGDSLYAIQRAVFTDRHCTGAELLAALRADFQGFEPLRAYLRALPKYGDGNTDAAAMVDRVLCTFTEIIKSHRNPYGGHCRPVILGFVWVVSHGQQVGATPDGRRSGAPIAHGLSPQSGATTGGITTAINAVTSLSLQEVGGGGSTMWDLDPAWATPSQTKALLKTFIRQGGHIFQGNVISREHLLQAKTNPEAHRDLLVRVGGYSAYFTTLSEATQDEIIARHAYGAENG